jgi:hypothetical protein
MGESRAEHGGRPISDAGLVVGIWFLIGLIYLAYLLRRHPERVRDMDKVFD